MNRAYIDTNVFVYAALDKTELGENARKIVRNISQGKLQAYASVLTIDEFVWVVSKSAHRQAAILGAQTICDMPNLEILPITSSLLQEYLQLYGDVSLKSRDTLHVTAMKLNNIFTILTNDKDFSKVGWIKVISIAEFSKVL